MLIYRGQNYYRDNRMGIFVANICGLIAMLAEPKGLKVLSSTNRSSTPASACRRYMSTIMHLLKWYEIDLIPGSASMESLNKVRHMHFNASQQTKCIGGITHAEVAFTLFGFMG